jgi:taspase (threonine aspartase 1)
MFVAAHAGAGFHSEARADAYTTALRRAVDAAWRALARAAESADADDDAPTTPSTALAAATTAVASLEDSAVANAGRGSSLAADGTAEADASAMRGGDGAFGAVGALPGVRNPCRAAALLAHESTLPLPLGLVRPTLLAGDGARRWALGKGLEGEADAARAPLYLAQSERARRAWRRHRKALDDHEEREAAGRGSSSSKRARTAKDDDDAEAEDEEVFDTVGAVAVDALGRAAAVVSSGGLALKTPGRVGSAAVFGAACWAADGDEDGSSWSPRPGVAVSASGVGERLVRVGLARAVAEEAAARVEAKAAADPTTAATSDDDEEESDEPLHEPLAPSLAATLRRLVLSGPLPHDAGVIACRVVASGAVDAANATAPSTRVEFAAAHTSRSFAIAYRGPGMARAEALILRRPQRQQQQQQEGAAAAAAGSAAVAAAPADDAHTFEVGLS